MVDQPFHALYEASWYRFDDDGVLGHEGTCTVGSPAVGFETGFVRGQGDLVCTFGERWSSPDHETLLIEGECSDGLVRDIELGFPADSAANSQGGQTQVEVLSVGGDEGWEHGFPEWRWLKCLDSTPCFVGEC
jgi:hypothetical protein